jgi:hypothetical protein
MHDNGRVREQKWETGETIMKNKRKRVDQVLPGGERGCFSGRREEVRKGHGTVNIVQILCTHVCKWKMMPVETVPGMGEGGNKGEWWRGEFKQDFFDILWELM